MSLTFALNLLIGILILLVVFVSTYDEKYKLRIPLIDKKKNKSYPILVFTRIIEMHTQVSTIFKNKSGLSGSYDFIKREIEMPVDSKYSSSIIYSAILAHELGHHLQKWPIALRQALNIFRGVLSYSIIIQLLYTLFSSETHFGRTIEMMSIVYLILLSIKLYQEFDASRRGMKVLTKSLTLGRNARKEIIKFYVYAFSTYAINFIAFCAIFILTLIIKPA